MRRVHLFISGRVQGVFFRAYAKAKAEQLRIAGWIRNLPDGRVEAVFEGEKARVDEMIKWCYKGSSGSVVTEVEVKENEAEGIRRFEIRQ